jgi:hypothetical protein
MLHFGRIGKVAALYVARGVGSAGFTTRYDRLFFAARLADAFVEHRRLQLPRQVIGMPDGSVKSGSVP